MPYKPTGNPTGRPKAYSDQSAEEILRRIAKGETMFSICKDAHLPTSETVRQWVLQDENGFSAKYALARDEQCEFWADEIIEIADDGSNDWIERETERGNIKTVVDHEHVQRSKLRIDARKWKMSVSNPKKWAERKALQHSGELNVDATIAPRVDLRNLTVEELKAYRELTAKAQGDGVAAELPSGEEGESDEQR